MKSGMAQGENTEKGKTGKKGFLFFCYKIGIKKAENAHKNVAFWGKS